MKQQQPALRVWKVFAANNYTYQSTIVNNKSATTGRETLQFEGARGRIRKGMQSTGGELRVTRNSRNKLTWCFQDQQHLLILVRRSVLKHVAIQLEWNTVFRTFGRTKEFYLPLLRLY